MVLEEGVRQGILEPIHINKFDMVADPFTRYLATHVWRRPMNYADNWCGALPERKE